jgi:hypothetical protein
MVLGPRQGSWPPDRAGKSWSAKLLSRVTIDFAKAAECSGLINSRLAAE